MLVSMRYMGIDFGTKKVGVALSDESGQMAFPEAVFSNDKDLFQTICNLITTKGVEEVVIGHSLDRTGKPNEVHALVEEFMTDLTLELGLPIHLEPEQYTTQAAIREQGRTDKTDASAAAIILNSYLSKQ